VKQVFNTLDFGDLKIQIIATYYFFVFVDAISEKRAKESSFSTEM
jgi:hypothetical protein